MHIVGKSATGFGVCCINSSDIMQKRFYIQKIIEYCIYNWKYRGICRFKIGAHVKKETSFEGMNFIGRDSVFRGYLGFGSYIGERCRLHAQIGRFTSIAPGVSCNPGTHPYKPPYATSSPCFFFPDHPAGSFAEKEAFKGLRSINPKKHIDISIGNDCWIGQEVFFVGGITVGDGAVVLARAVVTKDIPPYAIAGGIPAHILGYRYDKGTIEFLKKSQWWNLPVEWLRSNWRKLSDIEELKKTLNKT